MAKFKISADKARNERVAATFGALGYTVYTSRPGIEPAENWAERAHGPRCGCHYCD